MTPVHTPDLVLRAIQALKAFDRRAAAHLLRQAVDQGDASHDRLRSIAQLAANIGELSLSHAALEQRAKRPPATLDNLLYYCREIAREGGSDLALQKIRTLPPEALNSPATQHFLGTVETQLGNFAAAQAHFRRAIAATPTVPQTWFALSVIKTFAKGDPDIATMRSLLPAMRQAPPRFLAQFCYALAKAHDDAGDVDQAMSAYAEGAAIMRREEPFDAAASAAFATQIAAEFTLEKLALLKPSTCASDRVIFVNGVPRSGTTLVEQILTSHSAVRNGAELNLMRAALIPAGDYTLPGALNYQLRDPAQSDPWGELGRDYLDMATQRFGGEGRIIDKTLNHARMMGLIVHTLPNAKVIWLRRNPEDCALSCYRTFFTAPMPWSWSFEDMASHFRSEDLLHAHWAALFPDRILTVPYEDLVTQPADWTRRILSHVGLSEEPGVFEPHKAQRSVLTASVAQVRAPISTARVGSAKAYEALLTPFRAAYLR